MYIFAGLQGLYEELVRWLAVDTGAFVAFLLLSLPPLFDLICLMFLWLLGVLLLLLLHFSVEMLDVFLNRISFIVPNGDPLNFNT